MFGYASIKQENFIYFLQKIFLITLTLHNSKTTCDHRKPIVDFESTYIEIYVDEK